MDIYSSISTLKGVGPRVEEKFNKIAVFNILDLLLYFPRDYEYINANVSFDEIDFNERQMIKVTVKSFKKDIRTKTRKTITTIEFDFLNHVVLGKWFNQPYIKNNYRLGESYSIIGKFKKIGNNLEVINPVIGCLDAVKSEIIPKYPLKSDISEKTIIRLINHVLEYINIKENLPMDIIKKYNLISLDEAIREIHFPKDMKKLNRAIDRLKFQELFTYTLKLLIIKKNNKVNNSGMSICWNEKLSELKKELPFSLTNAQTKVVREILLDQKSSNCMNRLVQGDVGSGKTIVAFIAIFNAYSNGYKACLMAPTEILASQHYEEAKKLFKNFDVNIELLTGSTKPKEKERIKERLKEEEPLLVIGTHALIQENVEINSLGIIVTDEQHRFGVEQRSKLMNKGKKADVIVMSATPIPRTLALYMYSDLDVSVIDELPPGRKKIDTKFFDESKKSMAYKLAYDEVKCGRQVYVVCPLIEENEKYELNSVESVYKELKEGIFKDVNVEIMHGKLKPSVKDEIINKFKNKEIQVLISTTVIEVGVNVPNASVMIVINAERFGLAQLHQLRGRVGRGEYKSYCILIAKAKSKNTEKRMKIMTESSDGFYIAQEDLKLRGSGEIFGMRQSGDAGLLLADLYNDIDILKCAMKEARKILSSDEENSKEFIKELEKAIESSNKFLCFN